MINGMLEKKCFFLCDTCAKENNRDFVESTADFSMCNACGRYDNHLNHYVEIQADLVSFDECDCHEKHGKTMHNNGGNYHYDYWKAVTETRPQ